MGVSRRESYTRAMASAEGTEPEPEPEPDNIYASCQPHVRFTTRTTSSMTGTNQHSYDGGQSCTRLQAEQADSCGDRKLNEVGRSDQGRWTYDAELVAYHAVQPVDQGRVEEHLNQDRNGQQRNDQLNPQSIAPLQQMQKQPLGFGRLLCLL